MKSEISRMGMKEKCIIIDAGWRILARKGGVLHCS
jgi:hypothetical protein